MCELLLEEFSLLPDLKTKLNPFEQILRGIEMAVFHWAFTRMEAYLHSIVTLNQSYS